MTCIQTLTIPLPNKTCHINQYDHQETLYTSLSEKIKIYSKAFIVTDDQVYTAQKKFFDQFEKTQIFVFPAGEASKNINTINQITLAMAQNKLDRDSVVIGVGGGVTTDMAAFAASIYQRGIHLLLIPTSLLAMVDASVGGKTGVDTSWGKNQIGTFYWPEEIYICTDFLDSLPLAEIKNGLAEMIKHGIIYSEKHFASLEHLVQTNTLNHKTIQPFILDSIKIKSEIVLADAKETSNKRILLNLGHTFAHAIESDSNFAIAHGHAVAIGLKMAAQMAQQQKLINQKDAERIMKLIESLFPEKHSYDLQKIQPYMHTDKKRYGDTIRFILPTKIGSVCIHRIETQQLQQNLF